MTSWEMGENCQKIGFLLKKFRERYSDEDVRKNKELVKLLYDLERVGDLYGKTVSLARNYEYQKLIDRYLFN